LQEIEQQNKGPLRGVVMDLRNNPGGVLNGAVDVADDFLEEGAIVQTKGRGNGSDQSFKATPGDLLKGGPLVVLVNGGSASASEIVAGALQDHHRALILGERTFGKGSVQTILPLGNGTAVKLTTARYYTPNGRSIQAAGIEPDIKLKPLKVATGADGIDSDTVKESDLTGHLRNEGRIPDDSAPDDSAPDVKTTGAEGDLAQNDYQLYEALNLLKGMTLLQNGKSG
jgi:carboxyl-terminal processing protease